MKIEHLDRETLRMVRARMERALEPLKEIGIHAEVGHISYTGQTPRGRSRSASSERAARS